MIKEFKDIGSAAEFVYNRRSSIKHNQINCSLLKNKYIILNRNNFNSNNELRNFINKNILHYKTHEGDIRYLVVEEEGILRYFKTIKDVVKYIKCSSVYTIRAHISKSSKENPYLIRKTKFKIYTTKEFIPIEEKASL